MIELKSERELALMRKAGAIIGEVFEELRRHIKPRIKTIELDRISERIIKAHGARPAFKNYKGYPANICTSINEVIVHGIPGQRSLREGDIISIDVGVEFKGYYADSAYTYAVGNVDRGSQRLIEVTKTSLTHGIAQARAGKKVSAISCAIQQCVESGGFNVIRIFVGHGIGAQLHEPPEIPNFGEPNTGMVLEPGMVVAIEPMVSAGNFDAEILPDGWTAVTRDRSRVAHFEHTVAITDGEPEVLTLWQRKSL